MLTLATSRRVLFSLVALLALGLGLPGAANGPVDAVDSVTITVSDRGLTGSSR